MYRNKNLFIIIVLFAVVSASVLYSAPDPTKRIDATHILMREIELPKRTRALAASGLSYADTNPDKIAQKKKIGQQENFWVRNVATGEFEQIGASLRVIGKHCYIFVADNQNVSQTAIQKIQTKFDQVIYPTNTSHFGNEWKPGIDGDNRVYLLLSDIKDGYQNPSDGYVAGYFFAGDQMMQSEFSSHSRVRSNEKEIIYIDTYPSDPEAENYMEIVAHEFQHMIHYNQDSEETTWVNEGCSQIAPVLCGFTAPRHYKLLKDDSDRSLNNWAKWNPMPDYGQVYLWNQYIVEILARKKIDPAEFFRALVRSKKNSLAGYIETFAKYDLNFSNIFTDFSVTNHFNSNELADGRFSYRVKHLNSFMLPRASKTTTYPAHIKDSVNIWGSDSHEAEIGNIKGNLKVSFSGYRRIIGSTRPYFRIGAILLDTSGQSKPRLHFMNLKVNPADKNRLIGSVTIKCDGVYDKLVSVVIALAPEDVNDEEYMPASAFIYDLRMEINSVFAGTSNTLSFSMNQFIDKISATKDMPANETTLRIRENYAHRLLVAVKKDLDKGSFLTIDAFIENSKNNKKLMTPYARDLSGMLRFYLNSSFEGLNKTDLQKRINLLDNI
jgi:hypothetical protein